MPHEFVDDSSFRLNANPFEVGSARCADRTSQRDVPTQEIPTGLYELPRRSGEAHLYRLGHPLAEAIIAQAKGRELAPMEIRFDYSTHDGKISQLKPLIGKSGWLTLSLFTVEALDQTEDHLIFAANTDGGQLLDEETAERLLMLSGKAESGVLNVPPDQLAGITQNRQAAIQRDISERNAQFFEAEADKLEGWADDLKLGLERELKELDRQIKESRRAANIALTLGEKLAGQKQIKALEAQRNDKRRSLFDAQDKVDKQREDLIASIEGKLTQNAGLSPLFTIRWNLK